MWPGTAQRDQRSKRPLRVRQNSFGVRIDIIWNNLPENVVM